MSSTISYAQRFEDVYLLRCFEGQDKGTYVDVGSGHPVTDNVSFAFYLKGWDGILVEPNADLAKLSEVVRPRDTVCCLLVGATSGHAMYYRVQEFHGLSTTILANAQCAGTEFGKSHEAIELPVTTISDLFTHHRCRSVDFLKIDVEGAEQAVLQGADFGYVRPRVVLVEALAPYTLSPSWPAWEPLLLSRGYHFAFFDGLNRYYVANEEISLLDRFAAGPLQSDGFVQFGLLEPALGEKRHPDHELAMFLARALLTKLPLLDRGAVLELLTYNVSTEDLRRLATQAEIVSAWVRLFGDALPPPTMADLSLITTATVLDLYHALIDSDFFRVASGRISASYAW